MNVFFDTDIILDMATGREPYCIPAAQVISLAELGEIDGWTSATIFINVFYTLRKIVGRDKAIDFLKKLENILSVYPTSQEMIHNALYSDFTDFEDGTQYFTACDIPVDCIITRNINDYRTSKISVMTAEEFISKLQ